LTSFINPGIWLIFPAYNVIVAIYRLPFWVTIQILPGFFGLGLFFTINNSIKSFYVNIILSPWKKIKIGVIKVLTRIQISLAFQNKFVNQTK